MPVGYNDIRIQHHQIRVFGLLHDVITELDCIIGKVARKEWTYGIYFY